jgi:hypothetical protein
MRRSLSILKNRMARLESRLEQASEAGCLACRGKEANVQVVVTYGDERPSAEATAERRCDACGRVIPYRYFFLSYDIGMKPPDDLPPNRQI